MLKGRMLQALTLALLVGAAGCDLQVSNPNQPDRTRALAGPDDVETLIASSYIEVWEIGHYYTNSNFAFNHMSSRHTATWGNMGMNDLGREPREPLPNTTSFGNSYVFEGHWQDAYQGLSAAADGIRAIEAGLEIGPGGERNDRARIFAKGVQGILTCLLGLWYDQGFLIDETTDLDSELLTIPYEQLVDEGLSKIDQSIAESRSTSFVLPDRWVNGNPWTNNEWADYLVSWKARCRANMPRTDQEAAGLNWSTIIADATNGMQQVIVVGEDSSTDTPWWDGMKGLATDRGTWHRMHMDWAGMADQSGEYQDWLTFPIEQRTARKMTFNDLRYPQQNVDGTKGAADTSVPGVYVHDYNATIIFRPERGTYRQSHYGDTRWDDYNTCSFCWSGLIEHMSPDELDLYRAEGAFRTGDIATTVSIVNETRVPAGLSQLTGAGTVPDDPGGGCTPRKRYDIQGRCGDLQDALIWEHMERVFWLFGGLEFWHGRRFDILPVGTALQLPIPASDLEVLQLDVYTFGGVGGSWAADDPTPPNIIPGNLNSALERAAWTLKQLEAEREMLQRMKFSDLITR